MSKKIDRVVHGPSWMEVILGALLSLVLGAVLGAVLLVIKPVVPVKELPKQADRDANAVYYLEGSRDGAKARQALAKQKAFAGGQSVSVTEDEINALVPAPATPAAAPAAPKAGEKKENPAAKAKDKAAAAAGDMLATGAANFRIRNGELQIGVPVTIGVAGLDQKLVVQARGGFVKQGDIFVFEPNEMYLGSCPVQRLPFVAGLVRSKFLAAQPIPDGIAAAWRKLANVTIEGNTLKLAMP